MKEMLPQNIEAECGVLGSIIIDPEAIVQVADFLRPEHFYRDAHRLIYQTITQLYEQREPADFITICDELERRNKIDAVGGPAYVTSLVNMVPTSGNVEHYGRIVVKMAECRRLIQIAGQIAQWGYDQDEDALAKAETAIGAIEQGKPMDRVITLREAISQYMIKLDQLHENRERGVVSGIPTGFGDVDQILGGLQPSDLIVLAARPAVGKTSWALDTARRIVSATMSQGRNVLVFSLEMGWEQLVRRLLAMESGINQTQLRHGDIEGDEWEQVVIAASTLSQGEMWIDDTPAISLSEMRNRARRLQAQHGIDLIIVDYMQLMRATSASGKSHENRTQEVSAISRGLKELARELNVPVVALAQLSRAVENRADKIPQLSDLRESGTIEQDSDVVMFIHKPDDQGMENANGYVLQIMVAKHRNGPVGTASLWFTPSLTRFSPIDCIIQAPEEE